MTQYIIILLDDTLVSFCYYANTRQERRLMPLDTLRQGIRYAMKENLNIQFVYPHYDLPQEYLDAIDSIDHTDIRPACTNAEADVVVLDGMEQASACTLTKGVAYVLRTDRHSLTAHVQGICAMLDQVERLNIVITDVEKFTDQDTVEYSDTLQTLANKVEKCYLAGNAVQLNLLTDRMVLDKMNNCGAGDTTITLAPDGRFYICPAFYLTSDQDALGTLKGSVGSLQNGLDIKNRQLYKLDHAPICRHCDAYQCRRCVWLNRRMTLEVNTPSHEQCVMTHLERNVSRSLLARLRKHGEFLPERGDIEEISYLDPFELRKEWK